MRIAGEIGGPVGSNPQVLSGGRMKAGGILFADAPEEAGPATEKIMTEIGGQLPRRTR